MTLRALTKALRADDQREENFPWLVYIVGFYDQLQPLVSFTSIKPQTRLRSN
jgi:hypothetical protein